MNHDIRNVQNTRSMNMDPGHPDEYVEMDKPRAGRGLKLQPVFTGEMFAQAVAYPVIVEGWEKKNFGRHKRRWHAEFTEKERNKVARYYGRFYRWYLVTGAPKKVAIRLTTITLLQRAANFFASVN